VEGILKRLRSICFEGRYFIAGVRRCFTLTSYQNTEKNMNCTAITSRFILSNSLCLASFTFHQAMKNPCSLFGLEVISEKLKGVSPRKFAFDILSLNKI